MFRLATRLIANKPSVALRTPIFTRAHSSARADLIKGMPNGSPERSEIDIYIGDHEDSYLLIPTDVGSLFQSSTTSQTQKGLSPKSPLVYHHDTREFVHKSMPESPRIVIHQDLALPDATRKTSPATLYHGGVMNKIALDKTFDAELGELGRDVEARLGPALEKLEDM